MNKITSEQFTEAQDIIDFLEKHEEVEEVNVEPEVKFVQTSDELGTNDKEVEEDVSRPTNDDANGKSVQTNGKQISL